MSCDAPIEAFCLTAQVIGCIALGVGRVILIDKPRVIEAANKTDDAVHSVKNVTN